MYNYVTGISMRNTAENIQQEEDVTPEIHLSKYIFRRYNGASRHLSLRHQFLRCRLVAAADALPVVQRATDCPSSLVSHSL